MTVAVTAWLMGALGLSPLVIKGRRFSVRDSGFAANLK